MCGVAGVWGAGEPGCTAAAQVMIEEVKVAERVRDMVDGLRKGLLAVSLAISTSFKSKRTVKENVKKQKDEERLARWVHHSAPPILLYFYGTKVPRVQ